ncbi:MAG TPA: hypothetical protein VFA50_04415 [Stellaceae bacterium]|nr:hypothetical protein [Stellaceae bacterium]
MSRSLAVSGLLGIALGTAVILPAAADDDLATQLAKMRSEIAAQQKLLEQQQQRLQELEKRMQAQGPQLLPGGPFLGKIRGAGQPGAAGNAPSLAQAQQQPVGQAPAQERPQVAALADVGGVLSPRGRLTIEPTFEYDNSQVNQLFFSGLEIVNAVFIGGLDATNARRNTLTAGLNARYGITNFLEASLRVPYVYRTDRQSSGVNTNTLNTNVEGHDLGDVEFGLHYQINRPSEGEAYYVANLRVKSDTGTGPFDVPFNSAGVALKDSTGSGFWAVEPSLTVLYPTDPVVLFGNVGYTYNIGSTVNKQVGSNFFGDVTPGGVLRFNGGMGFGINDRVSLSLGYEHDWVMSTDSTVNGVKQSSDELQVGSFNLGLSYAFTPTTSANFTVAIGATRDAPDVRVLLSVPIAFDLLK